MGICRDRFYFASCCKVNYDDDLEEDKPEFEAVEAEIEEKIINDEGMENNEVDYFVRINPLAKVLFPAKFTIFGRQ